MCYTSATVSVTHEAARVTQKRYTRATLVLHMCNFVLHRWAAVVVAAAAARQRIPAERVGGAA